MNERFWIDRWKRQQIGFHESEVNADLRNFWSAIGASDRETVFVPLCGKSRDMVWLREQGHAVIGVELSRVAVKAFFDENRLSPRWTREGKFDVCEADGIRILCGNFFALSPSDLQGATAVYDRAALVAFPPAMQQSYVSHMLRLLDGRACILLVTVELEQMEMQGPPFSVSSADVERLYGDTAEILLLSRRASERSVLRNCVYLITQLSHESVK